MRIPRSLPLSLAVAMLASPLWFASCLTTTYAQGPQAGGQTGPTIKEAYKDYFLIGTAGDVPGGFSELELNVIRDHFNAFTPENYLKPAAIHPAEHIWSFGRTDTMINWCLENKIVVHGHTLMWHSQTNPWFFQGGDRATITKRLEDHIATLVGHYKGKIYSWDVINEAINDGGNGQSENLRNSQWLQNLGPQYFNIAFKAAHAADPEAKLYYNDYNIEAGAKHESSMHLLRRLKAEGVPVHGVGIQGHWSTTNLPLAALDRAITNYASLGLKVSISELDITIAGTSGGQLNPGRGRGARGAQGGGAGLPAPSALRTVDGEQLYLAAALAQAGGVGPAAPAGRGGRGGGVAAAPPANPVDAILTFFSDLTEDQRARLTALSQQFATRLSQWQTSSQEALLVVQPQYSAGQLAYDHEVAHQNLGSVSKQ